MRILGGYVKFISLLSILVLTACSGRGIEPTEIYYLGQANLDTIPSSTQKITDVCGDFMKNQHYKILIFSPLKSHNSSQAICHSF